MRFGVKAALGDAREMAGLDVELLEVHLGTEDLPRHSRAVVDLFRSIRMEHGHDLVVHAPEFMMTGAGPMLVDLASEDPSILSLSLSTLEATLGMAREVGAFLVVTHPGGITPEPGAPHVGGGMDRLIGSLAHLRDMAREGGVKLTVENMPWFYHHKPVAGGEPQRWESTLLVTPDDMGVLAPHVDGMTLDVCHAYLHSPEGGMDAIQGFIEAHADRILHLHLSDALPPDHEGLQVGEGAVDFGYVMSAFAGRDLTAVPEIMGGHRGGGISFRRALEILRSIAASAP